MDDLESRASKLRSLKSEMDGPTRNGLALRLAEEKVAGADKVLVQLIERPDLANNRGTLVYALRHYDCAPYVSLLATLVATGNFEVAHEAFLALDGIQEVEGDEVRAAYKTTKASRGRDDLEDWRRSLLDDLLDMFE